MSATTLRKGWCPGVLRPMPSGDGLLVRVRLTASELPAATAVAIAALSQEHGNGSIDLTRRANLQLRGVVEASLPALTRGLAELGLLDATAEGEAVRNVMVSPLAGLDPICADGREIVRDLERRLVEDAALHALPPKFGFAIDGGGSWPLGETGADITLSGSVATGRWRVRLAGTSVQSPPLAAGSEVECLLTIARGFLNHRLPRLRDWIARDGAAAVLAMAGLIADAAPARAMRAKAEAGALPLASGRTIAAIGVPFGYLEARQLARLAEAAGNGAALRLTPWRLLAIPAADILAMPRILKTANALGLITTLDDPRLGIEACVGSPGCANASTSTRDDASRLADLELKAFAGGTRLHVSGCAKGCAHRGKAGVTLIGRNGTYDLVVKGGVGDQPVQRGIIAETLAETVARTFELSGNSP